MKSTLHLVEREGLETVRWRESRHFTGVRFGVRRVTMQARMELLEQVRELAKKIPFLEAGERFEDKVEAAYLSAAVDRLYLEWGLRGVEGLVVDGTRVGVAEFAEVAPEVLGREVVEAVKSELGLSEEERKN